MGSYINPQTCSKEQWLKDNAYEIDIEHTDLRPDGEMAVCLVNNGPFTAAGIIFNRREWKCFTDAGDSRPKKWFSAKIEDLKKVSDLEKHILQ